MHFSNLCSRAKGFVLSPLPELGTMGSKWGGARVTDSSTSSRIWVAAELTDSVIRLKNEGFWNCANPEFKSQSEHLCS
jgi:hypothetical protein